MEKGELSYSKVRALTRVACANTEEYLLEIALHGTAGHVEKAGAVLSACERSRRAVARGRAATQSRLYLHLG